jgi:hypothetical protein
VVETQTYIKQGYAVCNGPSVRYLAASALVSGPCNCKEIVEERDNITVKELLTICRTRMFLILSTRFISLFSPFHTTKSIIFKKFLSHKQQSLCRFIWVKFPNQNFVSVFILLKLCIVPRLSNPIEFDLLENIWIIIPTNCNVPRCVTCYTFLYTFSLSLLSTHHRTLF